MKNILIILSAATLLASCGIYTNYKRPSDVKTSNLYGNETTSQSDVDSTSLASTPWRKIFTDTKLQKLIESGLKNNTNLATARLNVEQAQAALTQAKLSYLPSIALAPTGNVSSFDHSDASWTYSAVAAASWQIDAFGSIRNAKKQAIASKLQTEAYQQAVHSQVISSIASVYYTLQMLDEQLRISEETQAIWKDNVRMINAMKDAGMQTEANVAQAEATYQSVIISVKSIQETINTTENAMCLLLAETPHHIDRASWSEEQFPENLYTGIPVQLLANRPDVRAAEFSLQKYFYGVNSARSAFYPSLTLSGQGGWTNSAGAMIINPGKVLLGAAASLTQPLFTKGANKAKLKIAKAQFESSKLNFQQTLLQAGVDVNEALTKCQTARSTTVNVDKQIEALQSAVNSTQALMDHGTTTFLQVLTARQSLLQAQVSKMTIWYDEAKGVIDLYQALGGGTK